MSSKDGNLVLKLMVLCTFLLSCLQVTVFRSSVAEKFSCSLCPTLVYCAITQVVGSVLCTSKLMHKSKILN